MQISGYTCTVINDLHIIKVGAWISWLVKPVIVLNLLQKTPPSFCRYNEQLAEHINRKLELMMVKNLLRRVGRMYSWLSWSFGETENYSILAPADTPARTATRFSPRHHHSMRQPFSPALILHSRLFD